MSDSPAPIEPTTGTTALARRSRAQETLLIEQRREIVAHFRFIEQYTELEIVAELAKVGIVVNRSTVSRDVDRMRGRFRQVFRQGGFDARGEIGMLIAQLRFAIASSFRDAKTATDGRERALHRQVGVGSIEKLSVLLQSTGLVNQKDFLLPPDEDGKKAARIPSGDELRKRFESITVLDGETISEAERSWLYGDDVGHGVNGNGQP